MKSYGGAVWLKENGKSKSLLEPTQIHDLQDFIKKGGDEASLRSLELKDSGKLIIVRTF
ncbi:MAG: hypothetical protein U1C50_02500 [Patescibacteria group bacterium]|nr:hypothetical protein [Patescibacteria group bacterium]